MLDNGSSCCMRFWRAPEILLAIKQQLYYNPRSIRPKSRCIQIQNASHLPFQELHSSEYVCCIIQKQFKYI